MAYADNKEILFSANVNITEVADIEIVQEKGTSETAVMSQKSVTSELVKVDENTKRIENLEGLTLSTITDNTAAYEKTVPSGVAKYAVINKVGGICEEIPSNNLCTFDGVYELDGKECLDFEIEGLEAGEYYIKLEGNNISYYAFDYDDGMNSGYIDNTSFTVNEGSDYVTFQLYSEYGYDNTGELYMSGTITGIMICKIDDADKTYKPYGGLIPTKAISIISGGTNFIKPSDIISNSGIASVNGNSVTITGYMAVANLYNLEAEQTYHFSANSVRTSNNGGGGVSIEFYDSSSNKTGTAIYDWNTLNPSKIFTVPSGTTLVKFYFYGGNGSSATYSKLMLKKAYQVPIIYYIPNEIQALAGWGIGKSATECNYLDCDRKVFVNDYEVISGVVTRRETAIETDVSAYLPYKDFNFIEVVGGGTIIAENENGADVFTEITYMTKA